MKALITSIVAAIILALILALPALGEESESITITMTGVNEISISVDKTQWPLGQVATDMEYATSPAIEWCTLTVEGNSNVDMFIVGEDAEWVDNPSAYKWTLSNDGTNGENVYGLRFRISGDTARGYVPVTKAESEFWPYDDGSSLAPGDTKQFGLKLLTPTYFIGDRQMQTQITISAAVA